LIISFPLLTLSATIPATGNAQLAEKYFLKVFHIKMRNTQLLLSKKILLTNMNGCSIFNAFKWLPIKQ